MPPIAGSSAKASGAECQCDGAGVPSRPVALGFGASRSSVESLKLLRASLREKSERVELLRLIPGTEPSSEVENLFVGGRCLYCALSTPVNTRRMPGMGDDGSDGDAVSSAMTATNSAGVGRKAQGGRREA
jgi:hypothetical protein